MSRRSVYCNEEVINKAISMYENGHNISEIFNKTGITSNVLYMEIDRRHVERRDPFRRARVVTSRVSVPAAATTIVVEKTATVEVPAAKAAHVPGFKELKLQKHVVCTMFRDRHFVPKEVYTNDAIFEHRELDDIFDFEFIDNCIYSFIYDHIHFDQNGVADADLICYVSGLQTFLCALCRICTELHINLTLMHRCYADKITGYKAQVFSSGYPVTGINVDFDEAYSYKLSEEISSLDNLCVVERHLVAPDGTVSKKSGIFCNEEDAWNLFKMIAQTDYNSNVVDYLKIDGKVAACSNYQ